MSTKHLRLEVHRGSFISDPVYNTMKVTFPSAGWHRAREQEKDFGRGIRLNIKSYCVGAERRIKPLWWNKLSNNVFRQNVLQFPNACPGCTDTLSQTPGSVLLIFDRRTK